MHYSVETRCTCGRTIQADADVVEVEAKPNLGVPRHRTVQPIKLTWPVHGACELSDSDLSQVMDWAEEAILEAAGGYNLEPVRRWWEE